VFEDKEDYARMAERAVTKTVHQTVEDSEKRASTGEQVAEHERV